MKKWWVLILCLLPLLALAEEMRIVDVEETADYTVLLTEEEAGRFITVRTTEESRRSGPWPGNTIFYGVWPEGGIELLWGERVAWYSLQTDGTWQLTALHDVSVDDWVVRTPWGLYAPHTDRFIVGSTDAELFSGPVGDALFDDVSSPDRTGWAVVKADVALLYDAPEKGEDRGRFFAGTPARILETKPGWVRLSVAAEEGLSGWMQAEQLALGEDILTVDPAQVRYTLSDAAWETLPPTPPWRAAGVKGPFLFLITEAGVRCAVYDWLDGADTQVITWGRAAVQDTEVLLVLTQEGDARRLWVCESDGQGGIKICRSLPLPGDTVLTIHRAEEYSVHEITLSWQEGQRRACFNRRPDGMWLLSGYGEASGWTAVTYCGTADWLGSPPRPANFNGLSATLFSADLDALFETADRKHRQGWAMVDSFFADVYAEREGDYLCRLWQGTPLRILQEDGAWCEVALGDGGLTGWTYRARLAIAEEIDGASLLPDLACTAVQEIASAGGLTIDGSTWNDLIWPVGETADGSQAILLMWDGAVGCCPSEAVLPGNG